MTLACTYPGCDVVIQNPSPQRKTTMCRRHSAMEFQNRPEVRARKSEAVRDVWQRPGWREAHIERLREGSKRMLADPAKMKALREFGRKNGRANVENLIRCPELRKMHGRRDSARRLAHIPLEYRDAYLALRKQGLTAAERTEVIRNMMEADAREFAKTGKLPRTGGK